MKKILLLISSTALVFFGIGGTLSAANDVVQTEPVWVISWTAFFLFLGITVFFMSLPSKRRDSVFNEEEEKEYEEKLAQKRAALIPEEKDEFED